MKLIDHPVETHADVDARQWVLINLNDVDMARAAVGDQHPDAHEALRQFCIELRLAKLRFLSEDRQDPGSFDPAARVLVDWADEAMAQFTPEAGETFAWVLDGIKSHRDRLVDHLRTPPERRSKIH